jgi:hypothetical protein
MTGTNWEDFVKSIADEMDTPEETVHKIYRETWSEFSNDARITDYLPVLVSKRVREKLRGHRQHKRADKP